jgi:hypothetical protein
MTTLSPGQNVSLTVSGTDAAGNPALGAANVSINAQDASGNALPTQVDTFTVIAGPATIIAVAISAPAVDDITTPPIPAGW